MQVKWQECLWRHQVGPGAEIHDCRLIAIKSLLVLIDVPVNANRGPAVTSGGAMLTARS